LFFHSALRGERFYPNITASEESVAHWLPLGNLGVSLFFFISGYIISYPFLSARPPRLSSFYKRRLLRLEPPYIVVMLGCFAVLSMGYSPINAPNFDFTSAPLWQSLVASLTYSHSFIFGDHPKLNPPTWSLEREVQFYLLAPFLLRMYLQIKNQDRRIYCWGILGLALLILGQIIDGAFDWHRAIRHSLLEESYGFVLGILVCDYSVAAQPFTQVVRPRYDWGLLIGCAGLLFTGSIQADVAAGEGVLNTVFGILNMILRAACILLVFFGASRGRVGRAVLGSPYIALIGGACYSIYLLHVPVMHAGAIVLAHIVRPTSLAQAWVVSWVVLIPLSIAAGMIFYVTVERPCMRADWPNFLLQACKAWVVSRMGHSSWRTRLRSAPPK
jgi:peptidoglycan/LPS O-acetylase OafA/YrhL